MKIVIYQNREVYKEESKIGNDSENKVETLEFEFPEEYEDFTKYIEFQIRGEKYVDLIKDNKYVITKEVAKQGKIKTQLVLKKNIENDTLIFKSNVFELNVSKSINATENLINQTSPDLIEKIVNENNQQNTKLDTLELDNATNKAKLQSIETKNESQDQLIEQALASISNIEKKNTEQDENITNNTESIEELKAENEELRAENKLIKEQIPSANANGNSIHIEDSSNIEMCWKLKGGHKQEIREGYNLLNWKKWKDGNVIASKGAVDEITENSITITSTGNDCYTDTYGITNSVKENFRDYSR